MTRKPHGAGSGLAPGERPIRAFNTGQAPGVRSALVSQVPSLGQPTKHPKIGPSEPWTGWGANQTHSISSVLLLTLNLDVETRAIL